MAELGCVSDQDTGLSDLFRHCMQTPEGENHEKALVGLSHLLPALLCSTPSDNLSNYRKLLLISPGLSGGLINGGAYIQGSYNNRNKKYLKNTLGKNYSSKFTGF